jgi:FMN phosphatase YigB (HAD superfamily)
LLSAYQGLERESLISTIYRAFPEILNKHRLEAFFEMIIVSSEAHCAKPDPVIYEKLLNGMNIEAGDALMIDDNPTNVAGAIKLGMAGIVFTSCRQLQTALALECDTN